LKDEDDAVLDDDDDVTECQANAPPSNGHNGMAAQQQASIEGQQQQGIANPNESVTNMFGPPKKGKKRDNQTRSHEPAKNSFTLRSISPPDVFRKTKRLDEAE
jgi:hypothetical protein